MSYPVISPLPVPPEKSDGPVDFTQKADTFLGSFPQFRLQMNAAGDWINDQGAQIGNWADQAQAAATAATAAQTQAQTAAASAGDSAAAANTSRGQAQTAATSAAADAQRAEDAADRAEAIVGPVGTAASKDAQTSTADTTPNRLMLVGAGGILGAALGSTAGPAALPGGMWYDISLNTFPVSTPFLNVSGARSFALAARGAEAWIYTYGDPTPALLRLWTSSNQFALGETKESARTALGITDGPGRVPAENNIGNVATSAAQTVNIDVAAHESSSMSMEGANTTGALTINFTNIPSTTNGTCVWYVDVARAGRKTINFTLPAGNTLRWAGGAVPVLSNTSGWRSQIMFEKKLGLATVYASVVREGLFT